MGAGVGRTQSFRTKSSGAVNLVGARSSSRSDSLCLGYSTLAAYDFSPSRLDPMATRPLLLRFFQRIARIPPCPRTDSVRARRQQEKRGRAIHAYCCTVDLGIGGGCISRGRSDRPLPLDLHTRKTTARGYTRQVLPQWRNDVGWLPRGPRSVPLSDDRESSG